MQFSSASKPSWFGYFNLQLIYVFIFMLIFSKGDPATELFVTRSLHNKNNTKAYNWVLKPKSNTQAFLK